VKEEGRRLRSHGTEENFDTLELVQKGRRTNIENSKHIAGYTEISPEPNPSGN
jgi:hypothetical protein